MLKSLLLSLIVVMIVSSIVVSAQDINEVDEECAAYGYSFAIAKWSWNDGFQKSYGLDGYSTSVSGTQSQAYWSSAPEAAGILSNEVCFYHVLEGGANGTVTKTYDDGIQHITFCGDSGDVPEFGYTGIIMLAIGALILLHVWRKKK